MANTGIPLTIVIDIDGTLLEYDHYEPFVYGQPKPGAIEFLRAQKAAGHKIILHTARSREEQFALINHLAAVGIAELTDGFQADKPIGHVYIDDRAVRFAGDWAHCAAEVDRVTAGGIEEIR